MADRWTACRRGKGTHAARAKAREFLRPHEWFLALDVLHCFESLDHGVVLDTTARIVKDARVLELFERTVRTPEGKGLPIGSLTSQWLANLVLDRVNHHVKESLGIPGYVRTMDDMVLFANDRERLRGAATEVESFLTLPLKLRLKPKATILAPEAARESDEATLRVARAFELIDRSKSERQMGHALLEAFRQAFTWPGRAPEPGLSLRRAIYLRDGGRCSVCGCHAALYVHVHPVDPRGEGGGNDPANLALLCTRCHALAHSNYAKLVPKKPNPPLIFSMGLPGMNAGIARPQVRTPRPAPRVPADVVRR